MNNEKEIVGLKNEKQDIICTRKCTQKKHRFTQFLHTLNEKMRKPIKSYVF